MISLDTETTGLDLRHGALPFFVTMCDEDGNNTYFEWDVDPLTRKSHVLEEDVDEIAELLSPNCTGQLVLQNTKFDVQALTQIRPEFGEYWRWGDTDDTLIAGHLLASNQPHDLTTMALIYLGINIKPYEDAVKKAATEARAIARSKFPDWRIAKKGLPEMPSAKDSVASFDMWLPRAIAQELNYPDDHPWWRVLAEYSNADSAVTLPLFKAQLAEIRKRGLEAIYRERLKCLEVAFAMESRGVTANRSRLEELRKEFKEESASRERVCENIAADYDYGLVLPKGGRNKSLDTFVFDVMKLEKVYDPKAKTEGPSLSSKIAIPHYLATLPPRSMEYKFIEALAYKRKRDTGISYMDGYERYWIPLGIYNDRGEQLWYNLYPSLNPTGTDTLRWSSSDPNEQNISKKGLDVRCGDCDGEGCSACDDTGKVAMNLRYIFGPAPGREWWSLDAENIELRIPAYESGESLLIDLFERPKDPPYYGSTHLLNFHTVYPDIWDKGVKKVGLEKVGPYCKETYADTWYQYCKNGGFAVQYGAVEKEHGTADRAFNRPGSHARLKARFSKLDKLNQHWIDFANRYGYVETIPDRSVDPSRGYPLLCSRNNWGGILATVPLNYHVQSTAMWWMMRAMTRVYEFLQQLNRSRKILRQIVKRATWDGVGADYGIVMQVHDELVFDFPKGEGSEPWRTNLPIIERIQGLMRQGGEDIGIPTPVGRKYHADNWSKGLSV